MSHMFFTRIESVIPLSESPDSGLRENVHQQVRYFFLDRKSPSFAVSPRLTMLRLQSPYRKIHLSFRWCDLPLRPHHCQDQCHRNSNRHFGKPMKCDLTCKTRSGYQKDDRRRYSAEPVCGSIRAQHGAKQPQDENANTEDKQMRPEVARCYRANERSKRRSN